MMHAGKNVTGTEADTEREAPNKAECLHRCDDYKGCTAAAYNYREERCRLLFSPPDVQFKKLSDWETIRICTGAQYFGPFLATL
jgi:hypothetical protein